MLTLPFLTLGTLVPALAALVVLRLKSVPTARSVAAAATGFAALCFLIAATQVTGAPLRDPWMSFLETDALDRLPQVVFALITLLVIIVSPKQDSSPRALAGLLILCAATESSYAAVNAITLGVSWWVTLLPFMLGWFGDYPKQGLTKTFLLVSAVALTLGLFLLNSSQLADIGGASSLSFLLMLVAVMFRKGVFPFHAGTVAHFQHGPLLPAALLFNGHLGALLVSRSEMSLLPATDHQALNVLGMLALISAVALAIRTFAERQPRRMIAMITLSQGSFILAGLAMENSAGVTGALLHWLVVSVASVGLAVVQRAAEVRVADARLPQGHVGLGVKAPRLAAFFLLCSLALIGLPGTLGYCAEDLLFHGALERHTILGIALPMATAFNAIHLMRLFGVLFLGVLPKHAPDVPDALPRERWPLALAVCFLIIGGLMPKLVLNFTAPPTLMVHETPASH